MFKDILNDFKDNDFVYVIEGCLDDYASLKPASSKPCSICGEREWNVVSGFVKDLRKITNKKALEFYKNYRYIMSDNLEKILTSNDIVKSINDNMDTLLNIIPEINDMIGFEHKHPHHHLDVWNHTLLALSLSESNFGIRLCLLLHDIGKPHCYQDGEIRNFRGHPKKSCEMSKNILKRLNFDNDYIEEICYLIENHDSFITEEDIKNNYEISLKRYLIQYCDALAHNPEKLEKRIKYLKYTLEYFKQYKSDIEEKVKTKVKYNI